MIQGRKRTKITIKKTSAPITSLHFEDMVLDSGNGIKSYTHRLRYRYVPTVRQIKAGDCELANRDDIVRELHQLLNHLPENKSKNSYFCGLVNYFKYLDGIDCQGDFFSITAIIGCIKHFNKLREKGEQVYIATQIKASLSFLLRLWGRESDLKDTTGSRSTPSGNK